jgi:hypothetical protein
MSVYERLCRVCVCLCVCMSVNVRMIALLSPCARDCVIAYVSVLQYAYLRRGCTNSVMWAYMRVRAHVRVQGALP